MSLSKFQSVWNFMAQYKIVPFGNFKYDDLTCLLCKNLMTDSCQSHCGCQYCFKCFIGYVGSEEKYCPGDKDECKQEYLVLDKNVSRNFLLNNKISKIKVFCPNQSCEFADELIQISDHLRLCSKQPIECPFVSIGCCNKKESKEVITMHLNEGWLSHTDLLIDCINNLKHEIRELKAENENIKTTLKSENEELRREIETMKLELMDEKRVKKMIYWSKWKTLCPKIDVDFVWKFEEISKNIAKNLYSESFYSNNYKLCLYLRIYSDDNIFICCHIMKGDLDGDIQWPMKVSVTLSIVDQDTLMPYQSETYRYDTFIRKESFNKPINDLNTFIGSKTFTKYSTIKDIESIIANDSIIVSCTLTRL